MPLPGTTSRPRATEADAQGFTVRDLAAADWRGFAALVLAPGIPLTHPAPHWSVERAREAGVEVIGDIELFFRERARSDALGQGRGHHRHQRQIDHDRAHRAICSQRRDKRVALGGNIGKAVLDLEPVRAGPHLCHRAFVLPDRARAGARSPTRRRCSTSRPTISTATARSRTTPASSRWFSRMLGPRHCRGRRRRCALPRHRRRPQGTFHGETHRRRPHRRDGCLCRGRRAA